MSYEDFISNLPIEASEDMVDEEGNPRKDVLIQNDKLLCHPSMIEKLREGMKLLIERKFVNQAQGEENEFN